MELQIERELTLRDLVRIYRRRRSVVYGIMAAICILTAIFCLFCTRRYQATGMVQVQKQGMDAMGLEDLMSGGAGDDANPLSANIEIQTQANILQSDTLALRTIEQLKLEDNQDFKPRWNPIGWLVEKVSPAGAADPQGVSLEFAPQRRYRALKVFAKNLKVKPVTGTRIIEIDYSNPDPKVAAAVVNTLTRALSDYAYETKYEATNQASKWLGDQLGDLRKDSEDLQAKVVSLQRQSGVYSLGTTDAQGREQAYSGVLDQLQQTTVAKNAAEQNRILKGAIAKAAETGNAEMLSSLAGNSLPGSMSQGMNSSLTLIQGLRQQEATEQAALREAEVKYGANYPKLTELRGNLAAIEHSIQDEIGRIKGRAESDYKIAEETETSSRLAYESAKREADALNNKAIEYVIVSKEAEQSRGLYEDLLKRLKEAGVLEGLKSSNITLIDPGRAPAKPSVPNVPVYMALAVVGGWVLGCCGAFLTDNLDNKVISVDDVEDLFKQSPLGVLPKIELPVSQSDPTKRILALADPSSTYVEALRSIRTSLLLTQTDAPPKSILVTSSIAGEGKSFCSLNLAIILAQSGRRTLIIDTDLRRGTLRQKLGMSYSPGLSDLLAGQQTTPPIQSVPGIDNLDVLLAGATPPNPTDLLESEAMKSWLQKFRNQYDFVVLDSAPVLPVTDSVALNTLTDATLLIVRSRVSERPQAQRSYHLLRREGRHYVGLILNGMDVTDSSYYGYHGYRRYGYRYSEDDSHAN